MVQPRNPFSTKYTRPGMMPYLFFEGRSSSILAERFFSLPTKRGLIVGPHGSGKSTLVELLVREFRNSHPERPVNLLRFSSKTSSWKTMIPRVREWKFGQVLVLDGYEQLRLLGKAFVKRYCSMRGISILATAHSQQIGFEVIWKTHVDTLVAEKVVRHLLSDLPKEALQLLLMSPTWHNSRAKHGENLRETLFDLYDWWHESNFPSQSLSS